MKALLIAFAVIFCLCNSQTTGGYTQIANSSVHNSSLLQSLAQTGAQDAIKVALGAGNLPNSDTNFKLAKINSVFQQVVNGINYKFNVTLTNVNNGLVMVAVFVINYQPSNKLARLVSNSYTILPHAPIPIKPAAPVSGSEATPNSTVKPPVATPPQQVGGYTLVPASQVKNSTTIQSIAKLGSQNIAKLAVTKLPTANPNFSIASINSVYQHIVNGINYKFNVTLTNGDGVFISGNFVAYYQPTTKIVTIKSYSYKITQYIPAVPQPAPINSSSSIAGGYTLLSPAEVQNNSLILSLADFGAQNVTQQAIASAQLPPSSLFHLRAINSVAAQVVAGINYRFDVTLANADNSTTIAASYVVFYQSWTGTRQVLSSSYTVVSKM